MQVSLAPTQTFSEAAHLWLESRKFRSPNARARFIAPATLAGYEAYLRALNRFFSGITLADIHAGHLHEYQEQRISGRLAPAPRKRKNGTEYSPHDSARVSPHKVNQELGLLQMILKRAGCWSEELKDLYEPLQRNESDVPKALSPSEQERWLSTAASRKEWAVVYWYSLVAFSTTASNCEMRGIKLGDVQIDSGSVSITSVHAKNRYRIRSVPLNDDALWAIGQLLKRALHLGASSPRHFLFPFHHALSIYDPNQPMSVSGLKKPWNEVRLATGLRDFEIRQTRHTAISRMAEVGVPIPTIMAIAGHMSQKMTMHYTWISEQVKRHAVAVVQRKRAQSFGVTPFHIPTPPARAM